MKLIVITYPTFFQGEAQCVDALFRNGLEYLHLRKPEADARAYETFLKQVESQYYPRIVLHDHFELAEQYGLKGVHLNQRNPYPPEKWVGHISRSCHSLEEVVAHKPQCDYLFLSPIFDSISKQGYGPSLSAENETAVENHTVCTHIFWNSVICFLYLSICICVVRVCDLLKFKFSSLWNTCQ